MNIFVTYDVCCLAFLDMCIITARQAKRSLRQAVDCITYAKLTKTPLDKVFYCRKKNTLLTGHLSGYEVFHGARYRGGSCPAGGAAVGGGEKCRGGA